MLAIMKGAYDRNPFEMSRPAGPEPATLRFDVRLLIVNFVDVKRVPRGRSLHHMHNSTQPRTTVSRKTPAISLCLKQREY